ncbi:putative lipid transfer [Carex littledalei]|uniref:Putative lipid transfer n=1 Tax=Carex littledalei TaxID=544730 RepID=A0A833QB86_9POAL|nr:putative lipid transfer [Carex littledalei]
MHLHLSLLLLGATIMLTLSVLPHQPPPPCSEIAECALALTAISPCFPYIKTRNSGPASAPSAVCCKIFIKAVRAGRARCVCYLLWDPLLLDFPVDTNRLVSLFSSCGASVSVSASSWIHDTCGEMGTLPPLNTVAPASTRAFNSSIDTNTVLPFPNEAPSCCSYFGSSSGLVKPQIQAELRHDFHSPIVNNKKLIVQAWIELKRLSPQAWSIDHLLAAVSSFGIVLDHTSMLKPNSIERMMVVVAVPSLDAIPEGIHMWIRGISRIVEVAVHGWIEEPLPHTPDSDTTPTAEFFEKVRHENAKVIAVAGSSSAAEGKGTVAIEIDTLLTAWESLIAGPEKTRIETILRESNQVDPKVFTMPPAASQHQPSPPRHVAATPNLQAGQVKPGDMVHRKSLDPSSSRQNREPTSCVLGTVPRTDILLHNAVSQAPYATPTLSPNPTSAQPTNHLKLSEILGPAQSISIPLKSGPVILNSNRPKGGPPATLNLNISTPPYIGPAAFDPTISPPAAREHSPPAAQPVLDQTYTHDGTSADPIPVSPSPPNSLLEPMLCDQIPIPTPPSTPFHAAPLIPKTEPALDPMEEEPSEYFSENELQHLIAAAVDQFQNDSDPPPGFEHMSASVNIANLNHVPPAPEPNEQVGSNSGYTMNTPYSPYATESSKGEFEDEMRACREECEREEELREQERAYQSALADPEQAHLVEQEEVRPTLQADPVRAANNPAPSESAKQTQLRRSARLLEQGDKVIKHYTPKKSRNVRSPKAKKITPKSLDPKRKEELIRALQEDALAENPLQPSVVEGIDMLCGLHTGLHYGAGSTAKRNLQLELNRNATEEGFVLTNSINVTDYG